MVRRRFLGWSARLTAGLLLGDIVFLLGSRKPEKEQGFVVINGWVLTSGEAAASKVTTDVVRLQ